MRCDGIFPMLRISPCRKAVLPSGSNFGTKPCSIGSIDFRRPPSCVSRHRHLSQSRLLGGGDCGSALRASTTTKPTARSRLFARSRTRRNNARRSQKAIRAPIPLPPPPPPPTPPPPPPPPPP